MLSVINGSMDIASTPFGKLHKDGSEKFFFKCSKDKKFKKFYISAEDCPRHTKEFLSEQQEKMSKLAYAQEFLAIFTDELRRIFDDELIKRCCTIMREDRPHFNRRSKYYLGVDVAGFGKDDCTYEVFELREDKNIYQVENIVEKRNRTTDTTRKILELNRIYNFKKIGIDDGGIGFGVFSELLEDEATRRKTIALNNASRSLDRDETKKKKLLKEDMYYNLLTQMENRHVFLLHDDELKASLASIQEEEGRIFGGYAHIAEGINRGVWLASKGKDLNIFARSF